MKGKDLFEQFDKCGRLALPGAAQSFGQIGWTKHPAFEGVELKCIVSAKQTGGQFSYHLTRIAPNMKIGLHSHKEQIETHEVVSGRGTCVNQGSALRYEPGVVAIFPKNTPHEVAAGDEGLCLLAKFFPAQSCADSSAAATQASR